MCAAARRAPFGDWPCRARRERRNRPVRRRHERWYFGDRGRTRYGGTSGQARRHWRPRAATSSPCFRGSRSAGRQWRHARRCRMDRRRSVARSNPLRPGTIRHRRTPDHESGRPTNANTHTYVDTADADLLSHHLELRRREGDGDIVWQLTISGEEGPLETRTDASEPPSELADLLVGVTLGKPLTTVATMRTQRDRYRFASPERGRLRAARR